MKIRFYIWYGIASLLFSTSFLGQDTLKQKIGFSIYPSVHTLYGIGFYKVSSGYYKQPEYKYFNTNFNLGIQLNGALKFKNGLQLELYAGYNRWNYANLFPVGIAVKPKINKKKNEFYLKFSGGHTFGSRYYDENDRWYGPQPKGNGSGRYHLKCGFEKNWHTAGKRSVSFGFELLIQAITSYYYDSRGPGNHESVLSRGSTTYKFAGFTYAYHF